MILFTSSLLETSQRVMHRLRDNSLSLVTAESCTAGLLAALLSRAEGAGECLHGGAVAYTKAQKSIVLGISADQLRVTGAVTEEVAAGMAYGSLVQSAADLAIAITGVLGPTADEDGNPVGLVYLAIRDRSGVQNIVRKDFGQLVPDALAELTLSAAMELLESYISELEGAQSKPIGEQVWDGTASKVSDSGVVRNNERAIAR